MLPRTRRPSATTCGMAPKSESSRTTCATARDASLPEPIATPMSASFSARASFTPSPIIATVCPRSSSARTIARFWFGDTRPITDESSTAAPSAATSSDRFRASTGRSAPRRPSRPAIAPTVLGSSPEITFTATPCSSKYLRVSATSGRSTSPSTRIAAGWSPDGSRSPSSPSVARASITTRFPPSASLGHLGSEPIRWRRGTQQDVGPTEDPRPPATERRGAPLPRRRERDRSREGPVLRGRREPFGDRAQRRVRMLVDRGDRGERVLDGAETVDR